ncbi:MAG: serine O-acetyltransferase [Leptolyngbyaceae cyanobacterium]
MRSLVKRVLSSYFSPRRRIYRYYSLSRWLYIKGHYLLARLVYWQQGKYGCYISEKSVIHPTVEFKHPTGIVIGEGVVIEKNVKLWQNVTIGSHGKQDCAQEYPHIEAGVKIFAGAVIIGKIRIGKNAVIGANCVVLDDVPENSVAVGVPYKNKHKITAN